MKTRIAKLISFKKQRTGSIIYEPAIPYQKTCYGDKAWAIPDLTMGGWTYSEKNCERGHWKRKDMYSVLGQDFITSVPKRYTCPYVYSDHVNNFFQNMFIHPSLNRESPMLCRRNKCCDIVWLVRKWSTQSGFYWNEILRLEFSKVEVMNSH